LFAKFPSIESFGHVWRHMNRKFAPAPVEYGAKIKLHGTNGAVRVHKDGTVVAQSRSRDLTLDDDNAGFAAWVKAHEDKWRIHKGLFTDFNTVIFYGEWAGRGIQKNDAVTKLNGKYFFVFAIQFDDIVYTDWAEGTLPDIDNLLTLPWHGETFVIDFTSTEKANVHIDRINAEVEAIGERDPFIFDIFGVEGPGEGLVLMPICGEDGIHRDDFSALMFKAKSEAHRVKASEKAVSSRIGIPDGVLEFVDMFVTDARCEQSLNEACDGIPEKPRTADFLKWMGNDVMKESVVELLEMGLTWKDVAGHVNKAAVRWFLQKCALPVAA
jgi:RNA ligase